jgi:membrane protease YdiL (CAAX protease family)
MINIDATARFRPLLWFAIIVMAPLFEESLFRGFLIAGMQRSRIGAILITAALWSLIHLQYEAFYLVYIFIGGILLGIARVKTGSLLLCI